MGEQESARRRAIIHSCHTHFFQSDSARCTTQHACTSGSVTTLNLFLPTLQDGPSAFGTIPATASLTAVASTKFIYSPAAVKNNDVATSRKMPQQQSRSRNGSNNNSKAFRCGCRSSVLLLGAQNTHRPQTSLLAGPAASSSPQNQGSAPAAATSPSSSAAAHPRSSSSCAPTLLSCCMPSNWMITANAASCQAGE